MICKHITINSKEVLAFKGLNVCMEGFHMEQSCG